MTTIAYKNDILCADTQVTWGDCVDGYTRKVFAKGSILYALSGNAALAHTFRDWIERGMYGTPPHLGEGEQAASCFVFPGDDLTLHFYGCGVIPIRSSFYAAGAGSDLALGAMAAGATAFEAVVIAKRFNICTGGEITRITRNAT